MPLKIFGRFDADSENVSAQESGVKDAEIVALGDQMGAGHFEKLQTLNVVSLVTLVCCQLWHGVMHAIVFA